MEDTLRKFLFQLALELGCTVSELSRRLSVSELLEWVAYYHLNPFGTWRGDLNAAYVCAALVGGKIGDHMPDFTPHELPSTEQLADKLRAYFMQAAGAKS